MALILSPFSWLLGALNGVFNSYGIAIIVFAVIVKILLFPFSLKGKRGMIQMNMLSGKLQQLKKQCGRDQEKYNQAVQELYQKENVNPMSGCLWTLLPLFVLIPLYAIIRQPLFYITGLSEAQVLDLAGILQFELVESDYYSQLKLAGMIPAAGTVLSDGTAVPYTNFLMMGLDLTQIPNWKLWQDFSFQNVGTVILVLVSAGAGLIFSKITQKTNRMNTTQASNPQMEQTNRIMMFTMPLMSLWIGFIMPSIMCVYWIANNVLSMIQELVAGKLLKKDYEAARVAAEEMERQEKEDEKLRKEEKSQEIARRKEEEKQNRGKKKKKPKIEKAAEEEKIDKEASRVGLRAHARGRAYDPNRYPNPNLLGEGGEEASGSAGTLETPQIPESLESPETSSPVDSGAEEKEGEVSWGLEAWEEQETESEDGDENQEKDPETSSETDSEETEEKNGT